MLSDIYIHAKFQMDTYCQSPNKDEFTYKMWLKAPAEMTDADALYEIVNKALQDGKMQSQHPSQRESAITKSSNQYAYSHRPRL